ncbi:hypothetical protein BFR06_10580 [Burkholderia pseudomallei]|nr:hypothetical protein BFR05_10575 [Burkholderia pseudomallei]APF98258.1 hypothetical protein BFR06_10580 [Burkholderia pseudomallei]APZ20289.1 hypothetical protein BGI47_17680 [Burkholderia pseudomallei]APZ26484.1 hypothetical protein BGI46_17680 [Burkholderia pseudomallei]OMZ51139.1 hypothetical protein AQ862_19335 [Burkholderia pseudomallei]
MAGFRLARKLLFLQQAIREDAKQRSGSTTRAFHLVWISTFRAVAVTGAAAVLDDDPRVRAGLGGPVAYPRRATVLPALPVKRGLFF